MTRLMRIVTATLKELEAIVSINDQFRASFEKLGEVYPLTEEFGEVGVREEIENRDEFVMVDNGQVVGALCLPMVREDIPKNEGYIEGLAVREDSHGEGIGRKLIEFAKRKSIQAKKSVLTVESFCLFDVRDFYLKCGFNLIPELGEFGGYDYYQFSMPLK